MRTAPATTTVVPSEPTATTPALARRFAARAVDGALLATAGLAVGAVTGFGWAWFVFQLVLVAGYFVGFDVWRGATPGKQLLGLRVVGGVGRRPTVAEAARREAVVVLGAVPFVGPVVALAGFATVGWSVHVSPTGEGLHDRLAGGTRVVDAR